MKKEILAIMVVSGMFFNFCLGTAFAEELPAPVITKIITNPTVEELHQQGQKLVEKLDSILAEQTAQMESILLTCIQKTGIKMAMDGVYLILINAPSDEYQLLMDTREGAETIILIRRTFSILGPANWSTNPPKKDEYPSIIFVDAGMDGTIDEREIFLGFTSEETGIAEDFFAEETFQGILTQFMEECSRNIPKK